MRTQTKTFLRTETKTEIDKLRETLEPEDQLILVLRVDRKMAWDDLARVLLDEDASAAASKKEAARLRKRFQLIKGRLTRLARERGLIKAKG